MPSVRFNTYEKVIAFSTILDGSEDAISFCRDDRLCKSKPQKQRAVKSILPVCSWASPPYGTRGR